MIYYQWLIFKNAQVRMTINRKKSIPRDMELNKKEMFMRIWISIPAVNHCKVINILKKLILTIDLLHKTTEYSRLMVKKKENSKIKSRLTPTLIIWWIITLRFLDSQIFQGIRLDQEKIYKLKMILFQIKKIKINKSLKMTLILYMVEIKEEDASKVKIGMKLNLQTMSKRAISFTLNQSLMPIVFIINQIKIQLWKKRTITQLKNNSFGTT